MAPAPGGATGGDPVDLATGLLTDTQTDLAINDILPISVTRTYQQSDTGDRTFGFGTSLDYDVFLYSRASTPDISWLILPGGGRIRYDRVPGTEVFAADSATTRFNGSLIASNGNGYDVRLTDGTTMVFGLESPLREIRDRYGNTVTITRYPGGTNADGESLDNGPVAQVTSPSGRWIRFEYAQNTRFTRLARAYDNAGREVRYTYNSGGRLATATDPTGAVSSYTYDDRGRMATATDNRGTVYLRNEYDAAGRVSKQTMADGGTYLFTYITGANDKIVETRLTDPRGTVSRVTFNASSAVTGHTEGYGSALAQTTTVTWNDKDQPVQVTDPLGRRTHLVYDAAGRVVELTQFAGTTSARTRRVSYEGPYGQISRQVDPLGRVTTYTYASDGALRTVTDPMSRITRLTTDDAGRLTSSRDNLGNETKYEYRLGDFAAVTDPLGRVSRQRTDAAGRIVAMVDPLGNTTKLTYDANDRVLTSTDPLGQVTSTEYDPNGNPVKLTDPKGKATKYAYDELNHLVTVTDPLDRVSTTRYDKAGHPVSTTSGAGTTTTFDYDVLGRRTATRFGVVNGSPQSTIQYRYDAVGRVTSTEDSAAGTIANSYNLSDNLVRVTSPQGRIDYAYNTAGQRTSMTVAGQPATAYTYNTADQLTAVRRGTDAVAIGYDGAGRRTDVRLPNGVTQRYSYTNAGMVSSIDFSRDGQVVGDIDYTYDASDRVESVGGTMADVVLPDAYGPASYDAANQLVKVGATDYSYDRDGKLLSDGTTTYTWNARQQLTAAGAGDNRTTYLYDGQGRRIGKTRGGATTGYLHDGPNVALELKAGVTTTVLSGGLDQVFSRTSGGATTSLLTDALGSTVAVAGADGQPTAAYGYEPFGATSVAGSDAGNVTRYTGRDDEGNGLYFHRARFYSTTDQRFLSQDPLGPAGGDTNLYAYVGNQPTGLIDPLGLSAQAPGTTGDQSWWQTLIHSDSWNRNIDNLGWVGVVLGTFAAAVTVAAAFVSVPAVVVAAAGAAAIGAVVITAIDTVNSCGLNPDPFQCGMGVASLFTFGGTKVLGKITKSQVARMKEEKVARMSDQDIGSWEKKSAAADPFGVTGVLIDWFGKLGG